MRAPPSEIFRKEAWDSYRSSAEEEMPRPTPAPWWVPWGFRLLWACALLLGAVLVRGTLPVNQAIPGELVWISPDGRQARVRTLGSTTPPPAPGLAVRLRSEGPGRGFAAQIERCPAPQPADLCLSLEGPTPPAGNFGGAPGDLIWVDVPSGIRHVASLAMSSK